METRQMAELKSTGELKLDIDGQEIVLLEEDLPDRHGHRWKAMFRNPTIQSLLF